MLPTNSFYMDRDSLSDFTESRLLGYAHSDDALVFGTSGLRQYIASGNEVSTLTEGRFVGIFQQRQQLTIRTDATGQELVYLYQSGDDWAISNSFMLLLAHKSDMATMDFYPAAAMNFHLKQGRHIGEQLVSHKTQVRQISILPIGHALLIDTISGALRVEKRGFLENYRASSDTGYFDLFARFLNRSSGVLRAATQAGAPLNLSLSGGYDSRLVLGLALAAGVSEKMRVTSLLSKPNDLAVAESLAKRFNLSLNTETGPTARRTLSAADSVRLYLLSCGATYLPFYPVLRHSLAPDAELHLTGDQPSGLSFLAGKAQFNGTIAKIASDIEESLADRAYGKEVSQDFLGLFDDLEIDSDHPAAPIAYYSAVRARHHGGRSWYKSLGPSVLFTPLMHSDLLKLDVSNAEAGHRDARNGYASKQKFFADAFSAIGGWATEEPFETPSRAFPQSLLHDSPFRNGYTIEPMEVIPYGAPSDLGETSSSADMYDLDLDMWDNSGAIKAHLHTLLRRSKNKEARKLFTSEDLKRAREQAESDSNLSHGTRQLCHIVSTDIVATQCGES